jgi:hypothetical protein
VLDAIRWDDETTCTLHGHRFQFVKHEGAGGIPAPPVDAFDVVKWPNMLDHLWQLVGDLRPYRRSDPRRNARLAAVREPAARTARKLKHRLC